MGDLAIKVEHVSKKYCKSLKRSMMHGITDIARNSLGFSSHSGVLRKEEFWALNDISFELKRGETLGIIGPNGSGKTTLLKMLNGIFWPDKGKITVCGRVGALIQVGAGFHPMLTGRENIYLNAAILGMSKNEVDKKFDSIIDFANIGDFIDSPVKFYSSGMFVRLGFAVAVHCRPDILLIDEILSVGDQGFQIKCFRRMNELLDSGTTVILVSHSMIAIERVCKKTMHLSNGRLKDEGETMEVIRKYIGNIESCNSEPTSTIDKENPIIFTKGNIKRTNSQIDLELEFQTTISIKNPNIVAILWKGDVRVCNIVSGDTLSSLRSGRYKVKFNVGNLSLSYGHYHVSVRLRDRLNPLCTYGINGRIVDLFVKDNSEGMNGINLGENGIIIAESDVNIESI
ncbi:MAG: ABC transporter ATP-binding protein [Candidatus Omnitrophica bacterium]|nr:ABC transporter ATP-binding protein [Candidatus Omnitrophota bacterium]